MRTGSTGSHYRCAASLLLAVAATVSPDALGEGPTRSPLWLLEGVVAVGSDEAADLRYPVGGQLVAVAEGDGWFRVADAETGRPSLEPVKITPDRALVFLPAYNWSGVDWRLRFETAGAVKAWVCLAGDRAVACYRVARGATPPSYVTVEPCSLWVGAPLSRKRESLPPGAVFAGGAVGGSSRVGPASRPGRGPPTRYVVRPRVTEFSGEFYYPYGERVFLVAEGEGAIKVETDSEHRHPVLKERPVRRHYFWTPAPHFGRYGRRYFVTATGSLSGYVGFKAGSAFHYGTDRSTGLGSYVFYDSPARVGVGTPLGRSLTAKPLKWRDFFSSSAVVGGSARPASGAR